MFTSDDITLFATDYLDKLYEAQQSLNLRIGFDTIHFAGKKNWTYDFLQALSDEIVEAKNCISWKWWTKETKDNGRFSQILDGKNLKIEIIDMLHFILCLDLIHDTKLEPNKIQYTPKVIFNERTRNWLLFATLDEFLYRIQSFKYQLNFFCRETIDGILYTQGFPEWRESYTILIWSTFFEICDLVGLTIYEIYELYMKKNEVNLKRQENDYSMLTKTEDDNEQLKASL